MRRVHNLKTTMVVCLAGAAEIELGVSVLYTVTPGYPETRFDPGCDATAEISEILVDGVACPWLTNGLDQDENLLADCLADWSEMMAAEADDAAEWREQSRRDQLMGGF